MHPLSVSSAAPSAADLAVLVATLPGPLGTLETAPLVREAVLTGDAPSGVDPETKAAVRDLLRVGGFKPSGRNKPASEYLVAARSKGRLSCINAVVDALNAVSLETGLPISVVDADRVDGALGVSIEGSGSSYVFNASGQVLDLSGLLCLRDEQGPCANAVKDSQRTKTHAHTRSVVVVVWGARALEGRTSQAASAMRSRLQELGATVEAVRVVSA